MTRTPSQPRISANDLAQFMVSSDTARMGIIRRAAEPPAFTVTRYQDVRKVLRAYLSDLNRQAYHLDTARQMFEQRADDGSVSDLKRDDAQQSLEVLDAIQRMDNKLKRLRFEEAQHSQPKLTISGVDISVRADLWVLGQRQGVDQIGGALLRMTQSEGGRREDMGRYVATMMRMHLDQNNPTDRTPANRLCMAIDVRQGEIYAAPASNTRRVNDIESACRIIAALWGQV